MVWCGERKGRWKHRFSGASDDARRGLDGEQFEVFVERRLGHDGGDAFRDHAFAGAGAADHQEVVATRDGDFDGAAKGVLAFHFGEVDRVPRIRRAAKGAGGGVEPGQKFFAVQEAHGFVERSDGMDRHLVHQRGFFGGGGGQQHARFAELARQQGERQAAGHGPRAAG